MLKIYKAILGSVRKWLKIAAWKGEDKGTRNCPLCRFFNEDCSQCPIEARVDDDGCKETPYNAWANHVRGRWNRESNCRGNRGTWHGKALCLTCRVLAFAEAWWLIQLFGWQVYRDFKARL